MKVSRKTLLDVLVWDSQARLVVPGWQRPYVWEETEVLRMWSDWCTDCARDERHFCGTLILRQMPESAANWELVDGQQRLVTFFTAFLAIRDVCRAREIDFSELGDAFTLPASHECRLVLHEGATQDRQVLNALLTRSLDRIEREILEASRVHGAYRLFLQKVEDISSDEIPSFIVKVLQNLDLVILTVNQEDDARRLLEGIGKQAVNHGSPVNGKVGSGETEWSGSPAAPVDYISGLSRRDYLGVFLESLERCNVSERKVEAVLDEMKSSLAAAQRQTRAREWLRRFRKAARFSSGIMRPNEGEKSTQKETADSQHLPVSERDFFFCALLETFRQRPDSQPLIRDLVAAVVRLSITLERPRYRPPQGTGKHLASDEGNGVREASFDHVVALVDEFAVGETAFQKNSSVSNPSRFELFSGALRSYLEKLKEITSRQNRLSREFQLHASAAAPLPLDGSASGTDIWTNLLRIDDPARLESQYQALVQTIQSLTALLAEPAPVKKEPPPLPRREVGEVKNAAPPPLLKNVLREETPKEKKTKNLPPTLPLVISLASSQSVLGGARVPQKREEPVRSRPPPLPSAPSKVASSIAPNPLGKEVEKARPQTASLPPPLPIAPIVSINFPP